MQRQGRHLERSNSKRALDHGGGCGGDDDDRPSKRPRVPALASVIVEALKVDSLQKLCSSLEPILRRVVSEEVERALVKLGPAGPARIQGRSSPKRIEGPDGRNLQLQFRNRLSLPLFTGGKVEGEQGAAIHVVLLDANTGHVVTSGPESSVKLDILVLEGDFNKEEEEGWSEEDFESQIVKEREGHVSFALMVMEDGSLGLAGIEDSRLHLWSRSVSSEGIAEWVQCRLIDLEKMMPMVCPSHSASVVGFAEGVGIIFISTGVGLFMMELKSGRVRKASEHVVFSNVLPYMRFYTPDRLLGAPADL